MSSEYNNVLIAEEEVQNKSLDNSSLHNSTSSESLNIMENKAYLSNIKYININSKKFILASIIFFLLLLSFFAFCNLNKLQNKNEHKIKLISFASEKKENNLIELKFTCKDPSIPVQIFNNTNQIKSHIKSL